MRIFNEEAEKNSEIILILQAKEIKIIIEALTIACKERSRKTTWKKMLNKIEEKAAVY